MKILKPALVVIVLLGGGFGLHRYFAHPFDERQRNETLKPEPPATIRAHSERISSDAHEGAVTEHAEKFLDFANRHGLPPESAKRWSERASQLLTQLNDAQNGMADGARLTGELTALASEIIGVRTGMEASSVWEIVAKPGNAFPDREWVERVEQLAFPDCSDDERIAIGLLHQALMGLCERRLDLVVGFLMAQERRTPFLDAVIVAAVYEGLQDPPKPLLGMADSSLEKLVRSKNVADRAIALRMVSALPIDGENRERMILLGVGDNDANVRGEAIRTLFFPEGRPRAELVDKVRAHLKEKRDDRAITSVDERIRALETIYR
jgi:hypothetical protein